MAAIACYNSRLDPRTSFDIPGDGQIAYFGYLYVELANNNVNWSKVVSMIPSIGLLLGVAASELTDRIVPLEDVWGRAGRELGGELLGARSRADVMDRVARALALRAGQPFETASGQLARRAVRLLEGGEVRVESVADRLGVTARHLRRAFIENVGIGPKEFARSVRLQRAVRMAATSCDWARIAADAGYYDQAHLIADFRQLVGLTPGAFFKRAGGRMARPKLITSDFPLPVR
ncbi:helix-turn-helix domain-containing protein [Sorangium sp. So ce118]